MIKKNWKKIVIIVLIVIIGTSVGAYAAYLINATDVSYTKSNGTTVSVKEALDELREMKTKKDPTVGDLVNYNANAQNASGTAFATPYSYSANTSNTSANDYTGSTTAATFSSNDTMTWKILDINNDTGAIKLIAADGTPSSLELKGRAGYAYCENILNNVSEVYGHGYGATGARSVTVEDINKITGYNPVANNNGIHSQSYTSGDYFVDLQYENGKVKANSHTAKTYSQVKQPVTADKYYSYTGTNYLANTTNTYKMIFQNTSGSNRNYWLASRCVNFNSGGCYIDVRDVYNGNVQAGAECYSYKSDEYSAIVPASPVITLKSDIQLTWDNANSRWNIS